MLPCFDPASGVGCSPLVAFAADINTEEEIVSSPVSVPPEAESPPMSFPERFLGVFISPGPTFEDIARRSSSVVTPLPNSVGTWACAIVGFVLAGLYLVAAIYLLSSHPVLDKLIGIFVLVLCVLFALGSLLALQQQYSSARVLWLIGGILGLPLGLVMIIAASHMNKMSLTRRGEVPIPVFIAPLIVAIVSGLVILETMLFKIGMGRMIRQSLEQSGQAAKMSAEQLEGAVRMGATLGTVFAHVGVLVFGPAMLLILAALGLGILVLIYGAPAKFKAVFSATCYANLVSVLGVLMGVALILFGDPEHFNAQNPIPSNVGFFLNPLETSKPLYSLAGSADILWIWTMVLMAMGWSRVSGGKAKTLPVFLALAGIWLIWVLGKMGFAAILG